MMKNPSQDSEYKILQQLFLSMTPTERASFTTEQLLILSKAYQKRAPKKHPVSIRMSIPLPYIPNIYFVLLAGKEQRSKARTKKERQLFWKSICLLISSFTASGLLMMRLSEIKFDLSSFDYSQSGHTALPWIEEESKCLGDDRYWDEDACWDRQHDALF